MYYYNYYASIQYTGEYKKNPVIRVCRIAKNKTCISQFLLQLKVTSNTITKQNLQSRGIFFNSKLKIKVNWLTFFVSGVIDEISNIFLHNFTLNFLKMQ